VRRNDGLDRVVRGAGSGLGGGLARGLAYTPVVVSCIGAVVCPAQTNDKRANSALGLAVCAVVAGEGWGVNHA